jgi:hypothetical protein
MLFLGALILLVHLVYTYSAKKSSFGTPFDPVGVLQKENEGLRGELSRLHRLQDSTMRRMLDELDIIMKAVEEPHPKALPGSHVAQGRRRQLESRNWQSNGANQGATVSKTDTLRGASLRTNRGSTPTVRQMVRNSLLPGLLKTLYASRASSLPIKVFEVSDVVLIDSAVDVGARNQRNAAALYCSTTSGFEAVHGLLDHIMLMLAIPLFNEDTSPHGYHITSSNDPSFFPGRQANICCGNTQVGIMGIIHPEVLKAYQIPFPASGIEINLRGFI